MKSVRKISKKYYLRQIMACWLACYMLFGMPMQIAQATPSGGDFKVGDGAIIDGVVGGENTVTVDRVVSVIEWDSLNTSDIESLLFYQGNLINSAVLNKVISGGATQFDGLLSAADMRIFIVNPAGIIFGQSSFVNANQLVASSMTISNSDFVSFVGGGNMDIELTGAYGDARVVANYGTINAADSVYLVGKNVLNAGTIISGGLVAMVAGDSVILNQPGSDVIVEALVVNHVENHTVDNGAIGGTSSNLSDQFGIDASSNTGTVSTGELVLAAGDVWSNAIENVQDLTATARGDIHFEEAIDISGDLKAQAGLPTQYDSDWDITGGLGWTEFTEEGVATKRGGDVYAKDTIDAGGSIKVFANGIQFDADVSAGPDADDNMTLTGRWGEDPDSGFHDIVTAGLTAGGNIDIKVTGIEREFSLDGLHVDDGKYWDFYTYYGSWKAPTYEPGTITLNGDVAAIAGNLTISNSTDVTLAATLSAGTDLVLKNSSDPYENAETLTGTGGLTLVAGNEIVAPDTVISVSSPLTLHQGLSINLDDYLFADQGTTDLTLISDNGSVTAVETGAKPENAADKWLTIGATADNDDGGSYAINLSGHGGITTTPLYAYNDDIFVKSNSYGGINVTGSVTAQSGSVTLNSGDLLTTQVGAPVYAYNNLEMLAEQDHQGDGDVVANDTLTTEKGYMNILGRNVYLNDVADAGTNMTITALPDHTIFDGGTVEVHGLVAGGTIDISGTDDTINIYKSTDLTALADVDAGIDIKLHNNTWTEDGVVLDAGQDVIVDDGKSITGDGDLDILADRNITLGGAVTTDGKLFLYSDYDHTNGGDILAKESLTTTSAGDIVGWGKNITVDGLINSDGSLTLTAADDITLGSGATSVVAMWLKADAVELVSSGGNDGVGDVWAKSFLDTGSLGVKGENITVDGTSNADSWIQMTAADNITLGDDATAGGNMILTGDSDTDTVGVVWAKGKLTSTGGSIDIYSSDNTTILSGDWVEAFLDVTLHNNTELDGGALQRIEATTGKLTAKGYVHKTSAGNLVMFGGFNGPLGSGDYSVKTKDVRVDDTATDGELTITGNAFVWLDGDIYSRGDMTLASNVDADKIGSDAGYMHHASGTIQSLNGDIDISASGSWIHLYGGNPTEYVTAGEDILLRDDTYIVGNRELYAGDDVVLRGGEFIDSYGAAGTLTVEAENDIIFGVTNVDTHESSYATGSNGDVTANGNLILTAGDDIWAHGTLSTEPGSGGAITGTAVDDIHLYETGISADADGTLTLTADSDDNQNGNLTVDGALYGNMELSGVDVTVYGNVTSYGTLDVDADDDIELRANVSSVGEMTMDAGDDIKLNEDSGDTTSNSNMTLTAGKTNNWGDVEAWGTLITTDAENGDLIVRASDNIRLHHTATSADAAGELQLIADTDDDSDGGDVVVDGALYGNMTLSGYNVTVLGNVTSYGDLYADAEDSIYLGGDATADGSMTITAGYQIKTQALTTTNPANGDIDVHSVDFFTNIYGPVNSAGNLSVQSDNDDVELYDYIDVTGYATIFAGGHIELATDTGAKSNIGEYLDATANGAIEIYGEVETGGNLTLTGDDDGDDDGYVWVEKNLTAGGDIEISSSDWTTYLLGDYIHADGSVFLNNNTVLQGCGNQTIEAGNGTLDADGWVWKTTSGNLYLLGNVGDSEYTDAISLNNNRDSECPILACLPAASTSLGNLEIFAENGDIQISGDLTTFGTYYYPQPEEFNGDSEPYFDLCGWYDRLTGGVSVIAENGKIYTEGASPENDTLNIGIVGNSDQLAGLGVDLPYQDDEQSDEIPNGQQTISVDLPDETKKAAIVVMSNEDLKFGPDTMLIAKGTYDDSVVDDRAAINFLDTPDTMIGGYTRDQGDAIDVAVYLASTEGDVHLDGRAIDVAENGTMVVDAYDTVTFGDFDTFNLEDFEGCEDLGCFLIKLAMRFHDDIDFQDLCEAIQAYEEGYEWDDKTYKEFLEDFLNDYFDEGFFFNIDRLEVVSRVTEWLYQAASTGNGTLPYAGDDGAIAAFEDFIGGDYIMRGAGLGNPDITDGRAWVLENPPLAEPLDVLYSPQVSGCPAAMGAVASELAIAEETLQISIGGMLALNPTIQPCNACAGLLNAAAILRDEDGSRMAALNQVFNEQAPANVPFSPAMAASIVTAFADQVDDGSQNNYATAMEYIDAFVQYVAILDTGLGSPVEDSTAFVLAKYGAGITDSENSNIAAFVAARLAGLETF